MATRIFTASTTYASEAARDAASGWGVGDVVYVTGVGYTVYDGAEWAALGGGGGDIDQLVYRVDDIIRAQVEASSEGIIVRIFDEAGDPLTQSAFGLNGAVNLSGPLVGGVAGTLTLGTDGSARLESGGNGIAIEADGEVVVSAADSNTTMTFGADGSWEVNGVQWIQALATGIKLNLPTADPVVAGVLWADSGVVTVSTG